MSGPGPFVSVIVPCRNEFSFIGGCLDSILTSDYPGPLEVIVADGMSSDGTRELLQSRASRDPRVRVIDNPERATPSAMNCAIAASRGEVILRFDAHAAMPADYLRRCVQLLLGSGADNAGGSIRTRAQTRGLFAETVAAALSSRFGVGNSSFRTLSAGGPRRADTVFGGCWRREIFSRIGSFNEKLSRGQDMEFNLRLRRSGGVILLDPSIVCDYYARTDLGSFWRHNFRNGEWAIRPFALSDIVPVRPRHLVPAVFVAALAMSFVLPFPWSIAVASAYGAANFAASIHEAWAARKAKYLLLMPLVFASLHVAYGLGSLWGCIRCCFPISGLGMPKHASRTES
ncbi:MAG TPA: glycosyltransferase family 2 protein [Bryobacteraceae bacterium]|nr:glycosyltransferase family 2 protein [Bryobacteraceae bacterium]